MSRKIVAANWKMNGSLGLVKELTGEIKARLATLDNGVQVVIIPPALYVRDVQREIGSGFELGVQNVSQWDDGAVTGELSAAMAADVGASYVLIGHSERRQLFGETDEMVADKVAKVLVHGLFPLVCVGETLSEREAGQAVDVVCAQVEKALAGIGSEDWKNIVVAYEPVWAIGTGKTATAEDAQRMHREIRDLLARLGAPADTVSLLYGGSVKPDNAAELFAQPDIDGGLIGGASLKADDFVRICQSA